MKKKIFEKVIIYSSICSKIILIINDARRPHSLILTLWGLRIVGTKDLRIWWIVGQNYSNNSENFIINKYNYLNILSLFFQNKFYIIKKFLNNKPLIIKYYMNLIYIITLIYIIYSYLYNHTHTSR